MIHNKSLNVFASALILIIPFLSVSHKSPKLDGTAGPVHITVAYDLLSKAQKKAHYRFALHMCI